MQPSTLQTSYLPTHLIQNQPPVDKHQIFLPRAATEIPPWPSPAEWPQIMTSNSENESAEASGVTSRRQRGLSFISCSLSICRSCANFARVRSLWCGNYFQPQPTWVTIIPTISSSREEKVYERRPAQSELCSYFSILLSMASRCSGSSSFLRLFSSAKMSTFNGKDLSLPLATSSQPHERFCNH